MQKILLKKKMETSVKFLTRIVIKKAIRKPTILSLQRQKIDIILLTSELMIASLEALQRVSYIEYSIQL